MRKEIQKRKARNDFPILVQYPEEQEKLFGIIKDTIENKFLKLNQVKWSWGKFPKPSYALSYSLFSLKDKDGQYHHFLAPRKKSHKLAEGHEGDLILGYELNKENEKWCLSLDAEPSIVLKIYQGKSEENLERTMLKINRQIKIMGGYYEKDFLFETPLIRTIENSYKIYVPMIYWSGKEAFGLHLEFENVNNKKCIEDTQEMAYRNIFLKSLRYSIKLIEAVEKLHEKGYLHRDIKPENFLLLNDNEVKLVDFDSAVLCSDENHLEGSFTPHYAPPEVQLCGGKWTIDAEKFSVGMTLHFLLFGVDTLDQYNFKDPEFQSKLESGIVRIDRNFLWFLECIAKNQSEKTLLKSVKKSLSDKISALISHNPSQRPALSEVKAVFQSALDKLESPIQASKLKKSSPSLFRKSTEPEEPSGHDLRSTAFSAAENLNEYFF